MRQWTSGQDHLAAFRQASSVPNSDPVTTNTVIARTLACSFFFVIFIIVAVSLERGHFFFSVVQYPFLSCSCFFNKKRPSSSVFFCKSQIRRMPVCFRRHLHATICFPARRPRRALGPTTTLTATLPW